MKDFDLVKSVLDITALEAASLHLMQALVWGGEVATCLSQARDEVVLTRSSMDGVLDRHNDLMKQLKDIRAEKDKEKDVQVLGTKKTISSSYICPADGSQYKQSAVGLVFMESEAGLAMETSKVESAVRNQAEAKLNQLEHDEPAETMTTSCKCY
ncbi:hypothetical protein F511_04425 [Dorcoceras hygrometricum]|uniref:Uncharacterized protein n=1 Tax=Dorcoceras hygrometricum TaxID=472368 RepID=A0A2Z7D5P2_9LAMI|nr:hypothetical protein F511_04425 [Dorcoceras hygrometricum]